MASSVHIADSLRDVASTSIPADLNTDIPTQTTSPLYHIKKTPGKGLGVFASRPLPRGTRIMCESPLLPATYDEWWSMEHLRRAVLRKFTDLSPDQQRFFLSLHAAPVHEKHWREFCEMQPSSADELWRSSTSRGSGSSYESEAEAGPEVNGGKMGEEPVARPGSPWAHLTRKEQARILAIFRTNCFGISSTSSSASNGSSSSTSTTTSTTSSNRSHRKPNNHALAASVFHDASRINHSCVPNAQFDWNPALHQQTVHAIRDIGAGDELSICYIEVYMPRARRRAKTLRDYGFECRCEVCGAEERAWRESDARRARMEWLERAVKRWQREHPEVDGLDGEREGWVAELVGLNVEEGLVGWSLAACYELGVMAGNRFYLEAALGIYKYCMGEDHPRVVQLKERLQRVLQALRARD